MNAKGSNKKAMRLLSLLLTASLFLGTQGFNVFAQTVSENGTVTAGIKERENIGKGESNLTEIEAGSVGEDADAKEENTKNGSEYQQNDDKLQQEVFSDGNISGNNVRGGAGGPLNPVHYCTKKNDGTDYTDFSYVYFGSYPQSEITDSAVKQEIDSAIIQGMGQTAGTAESREGIDVWVNGTKYRRISIDDTNNADQFNNMPANNGYRYFKWERIRWKVLQNDGRTLFLVADKAIDCKNYEEVSEDIKWETSTIRNWLNNRFYKTAFSRSEQYAIVTQNMKKENSTNDNIYLLSFNEATNEAYGFCNGAVRSMSRRMKASDYSNARGTFRFRVSGYAGNCEWWLHSPNDDSDYREHAVTVGYTGGIYYQGYRNNYGVCPALYVNLSSDTWFVTDDGTSGEGGNGGESDNCVQAPQASLPGGTYTTAQKITLSSATEGAEIYYTTDGSMPRKENGSLYAGMIAVKDSLTIKAVAVKDGMEDSNVMEVTYTFSTETSETVTIPQLSLGEEKSGFVENKEAVRFFPGNYKLSSALIPVAASKSTEPDGSYKLKLAIGIGRADWLDDSTQWNKYKKSVDALEKSSKRLDMMESLQRAFGGRTVSFFEAKGFKAKPEVSALGYYELEIDKNGNVVKNTGMFQMDAKWKGSMDWQFLTPIGPMYLSLEGSGKVTGKLGVSYKPGKHSLSEGTWGMDGKAALTPGISLEGGYGLKKVATVGANGSAEVPVQIIPATKGEFNASASVHVYVVFVLDRTWDLATYHTELWDTTGTKTGSKSGISRGAVTDMQLNPADLKPVDRSYAEHTTSWQGNAVDAAQNNGSLPARAGAAGETTAGGTEHVLQSGIMPNSLPMIKQVGNDTVMVFQANAVDRSILDSSVLMYSVYRGGTWTEPVPVWDNGTCDMYADMQVINDELYLVWQKESARIAENGEDGAQILSRMAEKSEICFAKYDQSQQKFVDVTYITSDQKVDMMPKLAVNGNKVTAVWITNSANSFLQEEGKTQILYADWENGAFSKEKVLIERESGIEEFAPYYAGDSLYVAYVSDELEENSVNQVFLSPVNGEETQISSGSTLTSSLQWQEGVLYYYENGTMKAYDMESGFLSAITAGESPVGANARLCINGGKTAVLWSSPDQTTGTYKVYSSVKTAEGFSEPVALYSTASTIKYLDGVLKADGSWQFMMNTAETVLQEPVHSLVFVTKEETPKIEVESITVDDAAKENEATPVSYMATNTSEETITSLVITIEGENGFYKQQSIPVFIEPGESIYNTVDVDLTEVTDTANVTITLCAQGQADTGSNTVEAVIGQTDLALEAAMTETEEDVCIVASVSNNSSIPADATLTLYGDVEQTGQIETVSLGEISKEEGGSHTFYIKKSSLVMNENGAAYMPLVVTSDRTDSNEDNNVVIKIAYATLEESGGKEDDRPEDDKKEDGSTEDGSTGNDGKGQGGNSSITDSKELVKITRLTIKAPSKKLAAGKKVKLTVDVTPSNANNKAVTWNTSNKKYATIDRKGKLSLKKAGAGKTVTVTAAAKDGSGIKATYKIKIMKHAVKSIKLKAPSKTLKAGKSMTVKATVKITGKNVNKTLKWQSSNTKYATVNKKGKVTAKKAGKGKTVTITAASTDGSNKKAKVKIKIK